MACLLLRHAAPLRGLIFALRGDNLIDGLEIVLRGNPGRESLFKLHPADHLEVRDLAYDRQVALQLRLGTQNLRDNTNRPWASIFTSWP